MKNKIYFLLITLLFTGLTGCIPNDEVEPWQENIVDDLTSIEWTRTIHHILQDSEYDEIELWKFNINATGYCKSITHYNDGSVDETINNFLWTFTSEFFDVISIENMKYWQIDRFTTEKLSIYETYDDPFEVEGQTYREYKEFTANK